MLKKRNQKGFTLIEIIAVLIILGILAAVALPRYFAMQDDARRAALQGALAAGHGNISMAYAKFVIAGGNNASLGATGLTGTGTNPVTQAIPTDLGDFTAAYSGGTAGPCKVTITAKGGVTDWVTNMLPAEKEKEVTCPWIMT